MTNVAPTISVIIPCYNAEHFIGQAIESVFTQTFQNFEVIVIDDGSTDHSAEVIRSFGLRIRAEFGTNKGASAARNRGTQLAQGKYIQYLDADDLLQPAALENRLHALESSNADVAYSDWQYLHEDKNGNYQHGKVIKRRIEDIHSDPQIALFTDFWAPPVALLYTKRIVDRIGGWNELLPIIQDARFLLDAAIIDGKFVYVPGVTAHYRVQQASSLSRRSLSKFNQDCFLNACQVEEIWRNNGGITSEQRRALLKVYGQLSRFFFEHDAVLFSKVLNRLYQLDSQYVPTEPQGLRWLSQILGYPRAERMALLYRKSKSFFANTKLSPIS